MLLEAVKKYNIEDVKKALDNGEYINIQDELGTSALMLASIYGYTKIAELLLENPEKTKINVNIKDNYKHTALSFASFHYNIEIVKLFLENSEKTNIDVNIKDDLGYTALIQAFRSGHTEIVKLLLKHRKIKLYDVLKYYQIKEILRRNIEYLYKLKQPKKEVKYYDKRF